MLSISNAAMLGRIVEFFSNEDSQSGTSPLVMHFLELVCSGLEKKENIFQIQ